MSTAAIDQLSFTLPDWRAALKRRIRRPRKPCKLLLVKLAVDVFVVAWMLGITILEHHLRAANGAWLVMGCVDGGYFVVWRRMRRGLSLRQAPFTTTETRVWWALWAAGVALSFAPV